MTFLELFLEASKDSESPRSYWLWSGLAAISAVLKRNVYIPRPSWRTYPNIFVILVGESGLRKGVPINLAKELVTLTNSTRVMSGRGSIQGIITDLATTDGRINQSCGFIVASEFSSAFVRDPDALTILTDLYDSCYHEKWPITLRSGKWTLIQPSITLLAGINPPHFEDFITQVAIEGGFVGRAMIIFEQEKATINPAIRTGSFSPIDKKPLLDELKEISRLKGEITIDEDATKFYEEWYYEFESVRKEQNIKDKTGAINRIAEHILKVAILLALSRKSLTINAYDMHAAHKMCTSMLSNVGKATVGQGKSQFAPQVKVVMHELITARNYQISRSKLLSRNIGTLDAFDLDRVIDTLIQGDIVKSQRIGNEIIYSLTEKGITAINFVERRGKK